MIPRVISSPLAAGASASSAGASSSAAGASSSAAGASSSADASSSAAGAAVSAAGAASPPPQPARVAITIAPVSKTAIFLFILCFLPFIGPHPCDEGICF